MRPSYIVIEGVIGAGKTTLAHKLAAHLDANTLLERPEDNPFLPRFYRDPQGAAFSAQMTFLLQRAGQMEQLVQRELFDDRCVADFAFDKDRLFAEVNLGVTDYALYRRVFDRLLFDMPRPDKLIFLHAPTALLLQRIEQRGRHYEQDISPEYLETLSFAYLRWLQKVDIPQKIEVDVAHFDLIHHQPDFLELIEALDDRKPLVRLTRDQLI